MTTNWNPWHGCIKHSPGCKYCYVYRQDARYGSETNSSNIRRTASFNLPIARRRDHRFKIEPGTLVYTCFTSDFWIDAADEWRKEIWEIIRYRKDLKFMLFTKRIDRFKVSLPSDWDDGYDNVIIGCTIENQDRANYRLPIFMQLPIKHKLIIAAPLLEPINLRPFLNHTIEEVSVSGESGNEARPCNYDWILNIRQQCVDNNIPFCFHQTGAHFIKDNILYNIKRRFQITQARKANIDYALTTYSIF